MPWSILFPTKSSKQGEAHETVRCRKESDDTEVVDFSTASPQKDDDEITLAETLVNIKKSAAKDKEQAQLLMDEEYAQQVQAQWTDSLFVPTQAQQRTYMSNYIKNMGGYTIKQLKKHSFKEIKVLFDRTMESIRKFVPMESEGQIAESKTEEGRSKEEKGIHVEDLQTKYPIIDWEIYTEGIRQYWKIIRVGNITEVHQFFADMIKAFDREDLVKL
nr:hypothetical protein [Tanacetum cinerariifolium]